MKTENIFKTLFKMNVWFLALTMMAFNVPVSHAQEDAVMTEEDGGYDGFKLAIPTIPYFDEALNTFTEVSPIDIEIGFTVASAYIWRGQNLGSDTSFQPYFTVSPDFEPEGFGDISFTTWANITKNNSPDFNQNHNETDFSIDYSIDVLEYGSISAGYIYYDFPHVEDDSADETQEFYVGASLNVLLSPTFTWYHDFDAGSGEWITFGISHDFDLKVATIATHALLAYNKGQWGAREGFSSLDFGASLPIPIGDHMTIEPFISYTKRLDEVWDDNQGLVHDELYGGFGYSISF
ncbi:MAG: hypothetical protein JW938_06360 [Candidatus Omnitrophica bacterium]|nr:hypothetical protein [Candidatus Omnitrophota bacterium]